MCPVFFDGDFFAVTVFLTGGFLPTGFFIAATVCATGALPAFLGAGFLAAGFFAATAFRGVTFGFDALLVLPVPRAAFFAVMRIAVNYKG